MLPPIELQDAVLTAWSTNGRVTDYLIDRFPRSSGRRPSPASRPARSGRCGHLHNSRCSWIKTLGREHRILAPIRVDHRTVGPAAGRGPRTEQSRHRRHPRSGSQTGRPRASIEGLRMAQPAPGCRACPDLLRRARGTPSRQIVMAARQLNCRCPCRQQADCGIGGHEGAKRARPSLTCTVGPSARSGCAPATSANPMQARSRGEESGPNRRFWLSGCVGPTFYLLPYFDFTPAAARCSDPPARLGAPADSWPSVPRGSTPPELPPTSADRAG